MKFLVHSLSVFVVSIFFACNKTSANAEHLKTLDSLNNSVIAVSEELKKTDTILLQKALTRFSQYKQFIKQNINDTITKSEADNLQHFYNGGKNLEAFHNNRLAMLSRASLIASQLNKLATDAKNNALLSEQAIIFISQEKNEAAKLSQLHSSQRQLFYTSMEEFKNSLNGVEMLIKGRNNGELPTIIQDTVSL